MPRGYLKKDRTVDAKSRRGGHSKKQPKRRDESPIKRNVNKKAGAACVIRYDDEDDWFYDYEEDSLGLLCEEIVVTQDKPAQTEEKSKTIDECGICYDVKEVMPLMKTCKHAKCCFDCFRRYYVLQAQTNVQNYPLRCWHPACSFRVLREEQIKPFIRSAREMQRHWRLDILARAQKEGKMVVHCPGCDHPRALHSKNQVGMKVFHCLQCEKTVAVIVNDSERILHQRLFGGGRRALQALQETIRTLETLQADSFGGNDGWALCPYCSIIISKGNGCDHMICGVCRKSFSWTKAVDAVAKARRYAHCLAAEPRSAF